MHLPKKVPTSPSQAQLSLSSVLQGKSRFCYPMVAALLDRNTISYRNISPPTFAIRGWLTRSLTKETLSSPTHQPYPDCASSLCLISFRFITKRSGIPAIFQRDNRAAPKTPKVLHRLIVVAHRTAGWVGVLW